jgi:phosphate transport system substrate-binding protein
MNISKKCLNTVCNNYENARKNNFNSCNDCAYLFKPGKSGFIGRIGNLGISILLISILIISGLVVSLLIFQNQDNDNSDTLVSNEISSPIKAENEEIVSGVAPKSETVLRIHGSNTIGTRLMPKLVEDYLNKKGVVEIKTKEGSNPHEKRIEFKLSNQDEKTYDIEIYSYGSATAFKDFESAACDIGMTSRKINQKEIDTLKAAGLGDLSTLKSEIIFALDGISVIVNRDNPVNSLSLEQISDIFRGKITNWSQLGGKDAKINVFSRDEKSGTYYTFKNLVLNNEDVLSQAVRIENAQDLSGQVSKDINSIGFTSFSFTEGTKTLAISQGSGNPVFPNPFNIATEDYYLSMRLYMYCPENIQNPYADEFLNYITYDNGQNIIKTNGFSTKNIEVEENFKPFAKPDFQNDTAEQKYNQLLSSVKGRLSLNFLFKNGSFELDNKALMDLEMVINFLYRNKYLDYKILLVGYSDNTGDYNMNVLLSEQRALRVKESILNRFGALDGRVDILGMGPEMPIASNETSGGRDRNRRVEVYIVKNLEPAVSTE